MKNKSLKIVMSALAVLLLSGIFYTGNVSALEDQQDQQVEIQNEQNARAIERYNKSVNVKCGNYGNAKVTVTISHNMTTGRKTVYAVNYEKNFDNTYIGTGINGVDTTPSVGSVISGNTIKVEVHYYQFGIMSGTGKGTIYL